MNWYASCDIKTKDGRLYSWGSTAPIRKSLQGDFKIFSIGDKIMASDVGGPEEFAKLADDDAVALEGTADARMARKLKAERAAKGGANG